MDDLISRQEVIKAINKEMNNDHFSIYTPYVRCKDAIKKLPCISQTEQGHWIEEDMFDGDVAYRCSKCKELFTLIEGTPQDNNYNYCPNCGSYNFTTIREEDERY